MGKKILAEENAGPKMKEAIEIFQVQSLIKEVAQKSPLPELEAGDLKSELNEKIQAFGGKDAYNICVKQNFEGVSLNNRI